MCFISFLPFLTGPRCSRGAVPLTFLFPGEERSLGTCGIFEIFDSLSNTQAEHSVGGEQQSTPASQQQITAIPETAKRKVLLFSAFF